MHRPHDTLARDYAAMDDGALVACVRHGDHEAFRQVMQRCNQRLFRVARGIVDDDAEAEDVVQEAYVHAYEKIAGFRGDAALLTWLTRIVLNEAHGRRRKARPTVDIDTIDAATGEEGGRVLAFQARAGGDDPAAEAARGQIRKAVEGAVARLPEPFRLVFILREIEGCTVEETAASLELRQETVKTRLHRARRLLRAALQDTLAATLGDAFPFLGARCERMASAVLARLAASSPPPVDDHSTRSTPTPDRSQTC